MILVKLVRYWIQFCIFLILAPVVFPWYISSQWRSVIYAFLPLMYKFSARYSQPLTDENRIHKRKPFIDAVLALYRCEYPDTTPWEAGFTSVQEQPVATTTTTTPNHTGINGNQTFESLPATRPTFEHRQRQLDETYTQAQAEGAYSPETILTESDQEPASTSTTPFQASVPAERSRTAYYNMYYRKYRWNIGAIFAEDAEFQDPLVCAQGVDEIYASFQPLILWCRSEHTIRAISHYEHAAMIQLNQKWTFPVIGSIPYMRTTIWVEFSGELPGSQTPSEMSRTMKISKIYDLWNDTTLLAKAKWARRLSCVVMTYPILVFADADFFWLVSRIYQNFVANLIHQGIVPS